MLVINIFLYTRLFDENMMVYIVGCLILVLIIMTKSTYRYDIILMDSNSLESLEDNLMHIDYLVKLLSYYNKDKYV